MGATVNGITIRARSDRASNGATVVRCATGYMVLSRSGLTSRAGEYLNTCRERDQQECSKVISLTARDRRKPGKRVAAGAFTEYNGRPRKGVRWRGGG